MTTNFHACNSIILQTIWQHKLPDQCCERPANKLTDIRLINYIFSVRISNLKFVTEHASPTDGLEMGKGSNVTAILRYDNGICYPKQKG